MSAILQCRLGVGIVDMDEIAERTVNPEIEARAVHWKKPSPPVYSSACICRFAV